MLEPGFNAAFELSKKQGAALVTKHSTFKEDVERKERFQKYANSHYDSWVAFAREGEHGDDVKPALVIGVDMTRDFAMMAYSNNGLRVESEFTVSAPGLASATASVWGTWRTEGLVHTNCGPQLCIPPSCTTELTVTGVSQTELVSEEYNQCVFIRLCTARRRPFWTPLKIMKASAGPYNLGSPDRDNREPPIDAHNDPDNVLISSGDSGDDHKNQLTTIDPDTQDDVFSNTTDVRFRFLLPTPSS